MDSELQKQISALPVSPGVYQFKNSAGEMLYIGKAKKLRQRVRSYFAVNAGLTIPKQRMVRAVAAIEPIITSTESEALILESILIKTHRPPYNVSLKDDKHYNFVKIDYRPSRPIVTTVRRPDIDSGRSQATYIGPFTSGLILQDHLRLLRRVFPYRKRSAPPTPFEADLLQKRSLGPIPQTDEEYGAMIQRFIEVLQGKSEHVIAQLKQFMQQLSAQKQFEKAAAVRDQIRALEMLNARQKILSVHGESQDVVSICQHEGETAANVFIIRNGKLIDKINVILQNTEGESKSVILDAFLIQYYSESSNPPKELILPWRSSLRASDLKSLARLASPKHAPAIRVSKKHAQASVVLFSRISIPHHGKKKNLIDLGTENAREFIVRTKASWERDSAPEALAALQKALGLKSIPRRIEGYDISNIQGTYSVGSMVVFANGAPDRAEYRKFKIKSVQGADDFSSLAEVLKRRFGKREKKAWALPDLVLLDGGKGQLSTVLAALFNQAGNTPPALDQHMFVALAKREEELFQGNALKKVAIDPHSSASHLLQRIRDEAHRFAQKYYHVRHQKADVASVLDEVPGIGPKTKKQLINAFGSIAGIKSADKNDIVALIGKAKAETLLENL